MEFFNNSYDLKTIEVYSFLNGGRVEKYSVGDYNATDINDLKTIAKIKAAKEGSVVQILPKIDSNSPLYSVIYSDLIGTIYERKCPDLRIISKRNQQVYVEYESYARPFRARSLSRMLNRGSKQASSLIIDVRETSITPQYVRRQIRRNLLDSDFKRPIERVWIYNGNEIRKVWG